MISMQQSNIRTGAMFMQLSAFLMAFLLLMVIFFSKATSFLWFNFYHSQLLDKFFTYYTFLGDGVVALVIIVLMLPLRKTALAFRLLLAFLVSGLFAQLLKSWFHAPRPLTYFNHQLYHHFIEGVTNSGYHSFPSGHTTTAFAIATMLACHFRKNVPCLIFFMLAAGVGYSRIYLGQHFVPDVLAGIMLGIGTAILIEYLCNTIKIPKFKSYPPVIQHEQPGIEL
jgi:membrane-associated phospholipid phosphatase